MLESLDEDDLLAKEEERFLFQSKLDGCGEIIVEKKKDSMFSNNHQMEKTISSVNYDWLNSSWDFFLKMTQTIISFLQKRPEKEQKNYIKK